MRNFANVNLSGRQRGAALLILLAMVSVAVIYTVVAGMNRSAGDMARAREQKTYAALAQAKAALIAYAVTYKDTHANTVPGYLPCPDMGPASNVEGVAATLAVNCGAALVSVIGRLPWQTLGTEALKDSSGECLWYAVSGTYKNSPNGVTTSALTSNMMNWDTNGQFSVMDTDGASFLAGSTADTRAVAVIFAPGAALSGQVRALAAGTANCGGSYTASAYLDTANAINNSVVSATASAITSFIAGTASDSFNDKLVYITREDIWTAIKKRSDFANSLRALTRRAAECTAMYGTQNSSGLTDKRLPWASATVLTNYAINSRYNDANNDLSGRLSYRVDTSRTNNGTNAIPFNSGGYYIFTNGSYCSYQTDEQAWYDNWKDHLFYALALYYRPGAAKPTVACGTCLRINGAGNYAAVVIFAGEKLSGKSRNTLAEKGVLSNYLEGRNFTNDPNAGGNSNYEAAAVTIVNGIVTFNDIVYGIDANLRVHCHPPTNGVMAIQNSTPQTGIAASAPAPLVPPGAPNLPPGPVAPYAACP